jgi:hypothetical protein
MEKFVLLLWLHNIIFKNSQIFTEDNYNITITSNKKDAKSTGFVIIEPNLSVKGNATISGLICIYLLSFLLSKEIQH